MNSGNSSALILTQYPLTTSYLELFYSRFNEAPQQIILSNLSVNGYLEILRYFHGLNVDIIYVPIVDENSRPLLPPLKFLALIAKCRQRVVVERDLSIVKFSAFEALTGLGLIGVEFFRGIFSLFETWITLSRVSRLPRIPVPEATGKKILYLKTNLWLGVRAGGAIAHTCGVIGGFLKRNYEVHFMSAEAPVALPCNEALRIRKVAPPKTYVAPRELNNYSHNKKIIRAMRAHNSGDCDIIYHRLSLGNYAAVILSRLRRIPLILEYNGSEIWLANNWGTPLILSKLAEKSEQICLRNAHLLVTVSDELRDDLIAKGVEPERIVTAQNGVNTDVFDSGRFTQKQIRALRKHYGISLDSIVITFVGTFGSWHGAEKFAQTVHQMTTTDLSLLVEKKVIFMFIGDGVKRSQVEELTAAPEARRHVVITGLIDQGETPLYLAASDVLISPHVRNPDGSSFFGSPTKLFEYLASGRPVIGSDLNQISKVLDGCPHIDELQSDKGARVNGACGVLVEPGNVTALVMAIKFLLENPEWREEAGRNARLRALKNHTWDQHVSAIFDGLQRVRALEASLPKQPVRLLFNGLHSKTGGGLTYMRNILPLIASEQDIDVHLCLHEDQRNLMLGSHDNITTHYLNFKPGFWRLQFREQLEVPWLARQIGADVTFSPANYGPLLAPNSVLLLRNALSVAFVERRFLKLSYWALVYLGTFFSLLASRRAITVSEYARRAASGGLIGLFGNQFSVVPHGVSEIFTPPKVGAQRENFLLAVSDLYIQKNFKKLISVMARLAPDHPTLSLKIAGRPIDEDYFAELKQLVAEEKLEGKVEFLGGVQPLELVELYRRCGVFVVPSTVETYGNPLVEAMACGAPIACSNTAAMPEVVGTAAEFFDPHDLESMLGSIVRLLEDKKLRQKLSDNALEHVKSFSWKRTAEKTLVVIREAAIS